MWAICVPWRTKTKTAICLLERGLKVEDPILCVIDGGKGIRKALRDVLGHLPVVQRCTVHKRRNVHDHLPKHRQNSIDRQIQDAYASKTAKTARNRLKQVISWLERNGEDSAAESLKEGLDETLTVIKLGLPDALRRFFSTTNAIENPQREALAVGPDGSSLGRRRHRAGARSLSQHHRPLRRGPVQQPPSVATVQGFQYRLGQRQRVEAPPVRAFEVFVGRL